MGKLNKTGVDWNFKEVLINFKRKQHKQQVDIHFKNQKEVAEHKRIVKQKSEKQKYNYIAQLKEIQRHDIMMDRESKARLQQMQLQHPELLDIVEDELRKQDLDETDQTFQPSTIVQNDSFKRGETLAEQNPES